MHSSRVHVPNIEVSPVHNSCRIFGETDNSQVSSPLSVAEIRDFRSTKTREGVLDVGGGWLPS